MIAQSHSTKPRDLAAGTASPEIRADMVRLLFEQAPGPMVANALCAVILVSVTWGTFIPRVGIAWLAALLAVVVFRLASIRRFRAQERSTAEVEKWGRFSALSTILVGAIWGLAAVLLLDPHESVSLVTMTVILFGLGAGSGVSHAPYLRSFYSFVLPALGTFLLVLAWDDAPTSRVVAVLGTIALIADWILCRNCHRLLLRTLILSRENAELRAISEEKSSLLESTLQSISQGICAADREGRVLVWNARFVRLLNIPDGALVRGAPLDAVHAQLHPPLAPPTQSRVEYQSADQVVVEMIANPSPDGGSVITYTDITRQKQREQALEAARKTAELSNAAKTRFLAAASHDLRQPIHALGLFFATLKDKIGPQWEPGLIGRIDSAIAAVDSMLASLLDISKLDAGVMRPSLHAVSVRHLFGSLAAEFEVIAAERGNALRFRAPDIAVRTDPGLIERVLRNLVANALRYTTNGAVLVAARRGPADTVKICVYDTGIGIPEDQLDQIFVEFHQVGNPERDRSQGLGLGLAIVRRIADLLRHPLTVKSKPGRGSCFSIVLPRFIGQVVEMPEPVVSAASLAGRHVLVLDDDQAVREGMKELLANWGCSVRAVGAPEDALRAVQEDGIPDLLVVDYRLRDHRSGIDAIEEIGVAVDRVIPALLITGDTAPERLREAQLSGHTLLHKPVTADALRAALASLI